MEYRNDPTINDLQADKNSGAIESTKASVQFTVDVDTCETTICLAFEGVEVYLNSESANAIGKMLLDISNTGESFACAMRAFKNESKYDTNPQDSMETYFKAMLEEYGKVHQHDNT